jgi:hypothetical protein
MRIGVRLILTGQDQMTTGSAREVRMRKVILPVVGILLLGGGVAIGWFAARRGEATPSPGGPSSKPVFTFRAADPELLAEPPPWQQWEYPGSRVLTSSTGGHNTLGDIEFGSAERIALTTGDDFDKVWAFYKDKCKLLDPGVSSQKMRFEGGGTAQAMTIKVFDDIQAHSFEGPNTEAVRARAFAVQSLRYTLIGFVYRPAPADSTCILLVYRPNKEFLSLLKEKLVKE